MANRLNVPGSYTATLSPNQASNVSGWKDRLRRYFGGHKIAVDPVTTGYHYLFIFPPKALGEKLGMEETTIGNWLTIVCRAVNIPNIVVNHIEIEGINNLKWAVPGTVELDGQIVTARFLETRGAPVYHTLASWVYLFRNMIYGVAELKEADYSQIKYKGHMCYALVRPDGLTVEFGATFTGVYPANVPTSVFNSEVMTQDKIEVEAEFHFDQMFIGKEVEDEIQNIVAQAYVHSINNITSYYKDEKCQGAEYGSGGGGPF